jgi:hypothetical protein
VNQTLKIAIPVVVGMAVIFGVTFFAQYTPKSGENEGEGGSGGGNEPPLRFFSSERHWDPSPLASLQHRTFPGFYERVDAPNAAAFWFENRNPKPVRMQIAKVSCSSCSGARVAPIPPATARAVLEMTAVSALPHGLFAGLPVGFAGPAAALAPPKPGEAPAPHHLQWQAYTFKDNPRAEYQVPAANPDDKWAPQWGVLELTFSVRGGETQKTLSAEFGTWVEGSRQVVPAQFQLSYEGVDPFDLSRETIDVGELSEESTPREAEVLVYSSTRDPDVLGRPKVVVQMAAGGVGEPGQFVTASEPVRVPPGELPAVAAALSAQVKRPVRVEAAYRFTVTVSPKVGDKRADLGPLDRDVFVSLTTDLTAPGKGVKVRGTVRGGVWLDNGQREINVGNYSFAKETPSRAYTIITDDPAAALAVVPYDKDKNPATPDFLQLALEKQPAAADRGSYKLTVTVPPGRKSGPWAGFVVLEVAGPKPQRIRIPIRGNGTQ